MFNRKLATCLLALTILITPLAFTGCSGKDTLANLQAVEAGAQDVVSGMSAADPRFAKAQKFLDDAKAFLAAYQAASANDPTDCTNLATKAAEIVSTFQSIILPLLAVSPLLAAAVAGIDVALRLVASHFNTCVTKALAPTVKGATARRILGSSNVGALKGAQTTLADYLSSPAVSR